VNVAHVNMISMLLSIVKISSSLILSASFDTVQHLHHRMECDIPTSPKWVVDSPHSHDFLDTKFPSKETILEVMASIENPKDEMMH
jgi:hypothetical protein